MSRNEVIERLQRNADAIKGMGATSLYLFGSTLRGDAGPDSDLDLFIDYDPARRFSLIDLVGIKQFLEENLKRRCQRRSISPPATASIPC